MEYELKYAKRKTVGLKVRDGKLIVSAPIGTSVGLIDDIVSRHIKWIEQRLESNRASEALEKTLTEEQIIALKRAAHVYFTERAAHFAAIMGAEYKSVKISSAKARFGSCSSEGNISFSYRLMLYPEAAREYVVVHELAHTRQMNHSAAFYKIIESVMPDYRERKKLLKIKA